MKVLLIHEHGRPHGGGALTALGQLHAGLRAAGIDAILACRHKHTDDPFVVELPRADRAERLLGKLSWRIGLNDVHCVSTFKLSKFAPFVEADIVNIHGWHTNYFNYLALPALDRRKPIVGTMHDAWNITGHCSQPFDCDRWKTGCGKCPRLETFPPVSRDATALDWKLKRWVYNRTEMTFVAPSRWLLDNAKIGLLKDEDVRQIPNPVDHKILAPLDRVACRSQLGLDPDQHVVMFISVATRSWGKGGDLLLAALESLPSHTRTNIVLLTIGEGGDEFASRCGIPSRSLGYVHETHRKAIAYGAADIIVQPSRAENQSLVILESMSCGRPVVAFDVGGNRELLEDGPCGLIAPPEDSAALSQAMTTLLNSRDLAAQFGAAGRDRVLSNYTIGHHVQRYITLFNEKIAQHTRRAA